MLEHKVNEYLVNENGFLSRQPGPSALWFCHFHTSGVGISEPADFLQNTKNALELISNKH